MKAKNALNEMKKYGEVSVARREPYRTGRTLNFGSYELPDPDWKASFSYSRAKISFNLDSDGHSGDAAILALYREFNSIKSLMVQGRSS